eukprot:COSAG01_NODE_241_length_20597_cov_8.200751_15_plen_197_part_00
MTLLAAWGRVDRVLALFLRSDASRATHSEARWRGGAFPSVPPAPRPGLLRHQNGRSRRRRAAAPKLERLDPRQRKGFVIVALAGGQAAGIDAIWCRHTISHCRNRMGLCSKILHPSHTLIWPCAGHHPLVNVRGGAPASTAKYLVAPESQQQRSKSVSQAPKSSCPRTRSQACAKCVRAHILSCIDRAVVASPIQL